jgi:hypothetical protein
MSIIVKQEGFNTPRAILEYTHAKNSIGDTVTVLRRREDDMYSFIATSEDSDFNTLLSQGYSIIEIFSPDVYPVFDHTMLTHSDDRCC